MKKRILIILLIILVVAAIVCGIIFFTGDKNNSNNDNSKDEVNSPETVSILDIHTVSEFEALSKTLENETGISNDKLLATIFDFEFLNETATISFSFDDKGNAYEYAAYFKLLSSLEGVKEGDEIPKPDAEKLQKKSNDVLTSFCKMFDCELPENIYVYNNDGTFSECKDLSAFQNIADEKGYLCFTLRDYEGSFYEFVMTYEQGLYLGTLTKHYDKDSYIDYVANISLYDEVTDI